MRKLIGIVGLIGIIGGCSNSNESCEICGDYELLNFSKVEVNHFNTPLSDFTFRRNLYVNDHTGIDQYSICSWNSEKPTSSWSRCEQKEVMVLNGDLKISQNGTWSWNISTREVTRFTNFNKTQTSTKICKTIEEGTWRFVNETHLELIKLTQQNRSQKLTEVNGKFSQSLVIKDEKVPLDQNYVYLFELEVDDNSDQIGLKSSGKPISTSSIQPENTVYSLTGGSVWMTMSRASQPNQLAHQLNR